MDLFELDDNSIIVFTLRPTNETFNLLGLGWISFSAYFTEVPTGESIKFQVPFEFEPRMGSKTWNGNPQLQGKYESSSNFTLASIWPSSGPIKGNTLVTVRIKIPPENQVVDENDFRIMSQCLGKETKCLQFNQQTCLMYDPCIQEIPITNLVHAPSSILIVQYSTLPFLQTANVSHFFSHSGLLNLKDIPLWNFNYYDHEILSIKFIFPSYGPTAGGTTVRIWISNLTSLGNLTLMPSVRLGAFNASVQSVQSWKNDNSTAITFIIPAYPRTDIVQLLVSWNSTSLSTPFFYADDVDGEIKDIIPSSGPAEGGYSILIAFSLLRGTFQHTEHYFHVSFDDQLCPSRVVSIKELSTEYGFENVFLEIDVPAHKEGAAVIMVRRGYDFIKSNQKSSFGLFWFESPSEAFGVLEAKVSVIPDDILLQQISFAMFKLRNIPSTNLVDYMVIIQEINCIVLRIDLLGWSSAILFVSMPLSIDRGFVTATISAVDKSGTLHVTSAYFESLVNSTQLAQTMIANPSRGSTNGGTRISVTVAGFSKVRDVSDLNVWFGQYQGIVDSVSLSGFVSEFGIRTPSYRCNSSCRVAVKIIGPGYIATSFDFLYIQDNPIIVALSDQYIHDAGGDTLRIQIANFPSVDAVYEIQVSWGGLSWNYPSQVIFSDQDITELLLTSPDMTSHENKDDFSIGVLISSATDGTKSVAFELTVLKKKVRLISSRPSMGPCLGEFMIDTVIENYPIRSSGSLDQNYVDISGPLEPWILLNGTKIEPMNLSRLELSRGSSQIDPLIQISFFFPKVITCQTGLALISIGTYLSVKPLVQFNLSLLDTLSVLSYFPSSGPSEARNILMQIELCCLWRKDSLDLVTSQQYPVVMAGIVYCNILNATFSGTILNLLIQVPGQVKPGPLSIQISSSPVSETIAEIKYFSLPARIQNSGVRGGLASVDWRQQSDLRVMMISPQQGPISRTTSATIFCSRMLRSVELLKISDVVVVLGGFMASIVSIKIPAKNLNAIQVEIRTPGAGTAGTVKGQLFLVQNPLFIAEFFYTYYNDLEPTKIVSISPSSSYQYALSTVVIKVSTLQMCCLNLK